MEWRENNNNNNNNNNTRSTPDMDHLQFCHGKMLASFGKTVGIAFLHQSDWPGELEVDVVFVVDFL
jgi:hypothetical protein